jgi:phospholipase A1/A2
MTVLRLLLIATLLGVASQANARWLISQVPPLVASEAIEFDVFFANEGNAPVPNGLADRLRARLTGGVEPIEVELIAIDIDPRIDEAIAPGTFRLRRYKMAIPERIPVEPQLELVGTEIRAIVSLPVRLPTDRLVPAPRAVERPDPDLDPRPPALSTHEPMYVIFGSRDQASAKLQLSFKYRLFDEESAMTRFFSPLGKLHFGYTQTSLWDIGDESAPFRDTSYRPSFFYQEDNLWRSADGGQRLSFAAGVEHESNGRGAQDSRSMNTIFLRTRWRVNIGPDMYLVLWPKLVSYLERADNPDIATYRGYGDLNVRIGWYDGVEASTTWRKGTHTMGSWQIDLTYPIRRRILADAGGFVHLQYFTGFGESLLDYNLRRQSQVRLGFSIVR